MTTATSPAHGHLLRITAMNDLVSGRSPVASFAIRAPAGRPFEIVFATEARLFGGDRSHLRTGSNFFSSRSRGWLLAPSGRASYVIPQVVLVRFLAARRLYYLLAAYESSRAERGAFSVPAVALASAPYVRISTDLAARSRHLPSTRGVLDSASATTLTWGGDAIFSARALDADESGSGDNFGVDSADESPATGPPGPDSKLGDGAVVAVEVRDASGAVTNFSHDYPIDSDGNIRMPSVGKVSARDQTLVDLRESLSRAFGNVVPSASINVTTSATTVAYAEQVARSERLFLRVLDPRGNLDPSTGVYIVDSAGKLHLPRLGDVDTSDTTLGSLEATLEKAANDRFLPGAVLNLTKAELH